MVDALTRPTHRIGAVVLAAGNSTRLGYPKQLIEHEGNSLVRRAALAALDAGADPVIVVVGASSDAVAAAVNDLNDVTVVLNPKWESGLASSLNAGLKTILAMNVEAALILAADQPLIDATVIQQLMDAFDHEHRIVASAYDDIVGVPAIFGVEHFGSLMDLKGDEGAGRWLRARLDEVTQITVHIASIDIDTPADAERLAAGDLPSDR